MQHQSNSLDAELAQRRQRLEELRAQNEALRGQQAEILASVGRRNSDGVLVSQEQREQQQRQLQERATSSGGMFERIRELIVGDEEGAVSSSSSSSSHVQMVPNAGAASLDALRAKTSSRGERPPSA